MPGVHLNDEGISQARFLAHALKEKFVLSEIISSPLERTLETATPIAEAQQAAVTIDERITEVDVGLWTGKSFSELADLEEWHKFNRHRSTTLLPGGESMLDVQARAWRAIDDAIARHSQTEGSTIAFVTHGDVVRGLLLLILGMSIDHIHRLDISPASVTELWVGPHGTAVRNMNQLLHPNPKQ